MGFWDRLLGRKESEAFSVVAYTSQGQPQSTPHDYKALADEGYSKNAIAYRCVNMIASAVKSIPFVLYAQAKDGSTTEILQHPILDLLKRPNPMMPGGKYWEYVASYVLLSGNNYTHAPGIENGKPPRELWPIRPDTVRVIPGPFAMPKAFEVKYGGREVIIAVDPMGGPSQMMQIKTFNPLDPWYGLSPIQAAATSFDQNNESGKWNAALMQNSARPSGAFIFKNAIDPNKVEDIRRQVLEKYAGAANAGRPMILQGDVDFKAFSFSPKDMEWIESKNTSAQDIATVFGVPGQLVGIQGSLTYANYEQARQAFWIETVIPFVNDLLAYHNAWLPPLFKAENLTIGYDKDQLDALTPSRESLWTRVTAAPFLSTNEKRMAVGYDEKDEENYDEVLVGSGQTPLSDLIPDDNSSDPAFQDAVVTPSDLADENGTEMSPDMSEEDGEKSWEHKVFGKINRREVWQKAERKRAKHERKFSSELRKLFKAEGIKVSDAIKGMEPHDALPTARLIVERNKPSFIKVVSEQMMAIGQDFGAATLRAAKGYDRVVEQKSATNKYDQFLKDWVKQNSGRRVDQISQTTQRKIARAVESMYDEEGSVKDLSQKILDTYKGFTPSRAMVIARTETSAASNAASVGAAKASGIPNLKKEWVSSNDDRSRGAHPGDETDHRAVDGAIVGIDEKFNVPSVYGIDEMDHPGDTSAPVSQLANCRCVSSFLKEESENE